MKKKYIMLALLSSFILHNNIFTMEKEVEEEVGHIPYIPHELIAKIIRYIVEDHIKNWDGITDFQIIKRQIARDLLSNHLVSKSFSEFHHKYGDFNIEYVDSVIKEIDQELQDKILTASIKRKRQTAEQTLRLIQALYNDDKQEVIDSINKGADINFKSLYIIPVLIWAAKNGHKDIVELLIRLKADVNAKYGVNDNTVLHLAIINGKTDVVKLLIKSAAINIDEPDRFGRTALIFATIKGYLDIVKLLIDKGANVNAADNKINNTALMLSAGEGYEDIVKLLIEKGANVNATDNKINNTALMWAVRKGYKDIVKLLIEKGANVNAVNKHGETALKWAEYSGHQDIVELLIRNGANN